MSSSQTSDRNTNMASSFDLSNCCSFVEAFTDVAEGPPKKLILPKHDLIIAQAHRNGLRSSSYTAYSFIHLCI